MSLTRAALDNDRLTLVVLLVLMVSGVGAYLNLPQAEDPGFLVRTATVITHFPGASPERVEQLITDVLETEIQEMPEIDVLKSQSKTGLSIITVEFLPAYDDLQPIFDDLRRKVERAADKLPDGVIGPTVDDDVGDVFGTLIAVTGDGFSYADLKDIADEFRDELLLIHEVAKVDIIGDQAERIFIEYSNTRLAELGLSPGQLQMLLESTNILIPGGEVSTSDETIVLEPTGSFDSVDDLRRTLISLPTGGLVTLSDVVEISRGYVDPPGSLARVGSEPALVLAMSLRDGGNILTLGAKVRETVNRLEALYPIGIDFHEIQFQADSVRNKVDAFISNLVQAVGIVLLVMLVSLGLRTGLVVASLIPMAIVTAFLVMSLLDIGIDQMSLAALIIALGLLVDNAIVMSESILVSMREGSSAFDAALESARELQVPLLVSSLTTIAAFLPIYLAESNTGEYVAPLFEVVTITLLASWILALTMVPLLCVRFLKVDSGSVVDAFDTPFYRGYRSTLTLLLRHRVITLVTIMIIFFGSFTLLKWVSVMFFPPNDRPTLTAELRLPVGTPIEATEAVVEEIEAYLRDEHLIGEDRSDGVVGWATFIGEGSPRFMLTFSPEQVSPEYAIMLVNTTDRAMVDTLIPAIEGFCLQRFPDLVAQVRPLQTGPPVKSPIEVRITSRNSSRLLDHVAEVKALMNEQATRNVLDDWGARTKKLMVEVDQTRARLAGVTNQDIAISLKTSLSGFTGTELREDDLVIPVELRSVAADRRDLGKIESLTVFAQASGRSVPLKQVADVRVVWQPAKIYRRNRLKTVTISADLAPGASAAEVNADLSPALRALSRQWSHSDDWSLGGENEASADANASIMVKLPIAALIIVLLLVGQFNSMRRAAIVLVTVPLGVIGVFIGLLVFRSYLGFMTLLGIISLSGIVINNAIVLLDRIEVEIKDHGRSPQEAIIESAQRRLRPILLTTFTTLGSLIPLYLGGGPMWEPLAVSIMGGLAFATLLTLGIVPVLYSLFFKVEFSKIASN